MIQSETEQQGLHVQSAETSEYFAFHQAVKWALAQAHPVTIFSTAQEQANLQQA